MTDLSNYDTSKGAAAGAAMVLYAPDGKPTDITFTLRGTDSPAYQQARREQADARMEEMSRRGLRGVQLRDVEDGALELLAAVTVGWTDTLLVDGEAYPFNRDNAIKLYKRFPWIREQVEAFIANRANFLPVSPKKS